MPRGKRTNVGLRCQECERKEDNYVTRLTRDGIKKFNEKGKLKFCPKCRKRTTHKAKEIKGGY